MIEHSESFKRRNDHNNRNFTPFEVHRDHFISRIKERFDIDISYERYDDLISEIQSTNNGNVIYQITTTTNLCTLTINGKEVWVLYGKRFVTKEGAIQPAKLKTALIPHEQYLVPNSVAKKFNHETFTLKVREILNIYDLKARLINDKTAQSITCTKGEKKFIKRLRDNELSLLDNYAITQAVNRIVLTYKPKAKLKNQKKVKLNDLSGVHKKMAR